MRVLMMACIIKVRCQVSMADSQVIAGAAHKKDKEISMSKTFYEVVFEGHYHTIFGLLEGFMMGADKEWTYYFSRRVHVKQDTFADVLREWVTLGGKLHHVLIDEDFLNAFKVALKKRSDDSKVGLKYIKSEKKILSGRFGFTFKAYAKKFGDEIKELLENLPAGVELIDYNPVEKIDKDARGVELYAPEHEYTFEGEGVIQGSVPEILSMSRALRRHPLIEVDSVSLTCE